MIKINIKTAVVFVFVFVAAIVSAQSAYAQNLLFSNDNNVSIGGNTYIIASGSAATSLAVSDTSITVTVPDQYTFTVFSTDRYLLNNDSNIAQQCTTALSKVVIAGPASVVITPSATACMAGGGSGSSGSVGTTTTTTTPTTTTQQLGPITISKPLNQMTRDELVSTLLKLILTLVLQGKISHL